MACFNRSLDCAHRSSRLAFEDGEDDDPTPVPESKFTLSKLRPPAPPPPLSSSSSMLICSSSRFLVKEAQW